MKNNGTAASSSSLHLSSRFRTDVCRLGILPRYSVSYLVFAIAGSKMRTHAAFLTPAATTTVADISDCDHEQSDNDLLASTSDAQAKSLETLCKHCGEIDLDGLSTYKVVGDGIISTVPVQYLAHIDSTRGCRMCKFFQDLRPTFQTFSTSQDGMFVLRAVSYLTGFHAARLGLRDSTMLAVDTVKSQRSTGSKLLHYTESPMPVRSRLLKKKHRQPGPTYPVRWRQLGGNYHQGLVKKWPTFCNSHHQGLCKHKKTMPTLGFKQINCETWEILTPTEDLEYVALSYMWDPLSVTGIL